MRVVELFSGAGGVSLGMRNAGCQGVLHVDYNEDACATARAAGFENVVCEFAQHLSPLDLPDASMWWASPPCPAWSSAGLRLAAEDHRNGYPHLFRLLEHRGAPRWLLIEQVEGITFHKRGCPGRNSPTTLGDTVRCPACYLKGIIVPMLRSFFPTVSMSVLDAADYGVPQRRNRLITVCGPARVPWPFPTHSSETLEAYKASGLYWQAVEEGSLFRAELKAGSDGCRPYRTMRQVLPLLWKTGGSEVVVSGSRGGKGPNVRSSDAPSPTVSTAGDLYEVDGGKTSRSMRPADQDRPSPAVSTSGDDLLVSEGQQPNGRPGWWHRSSPMDEPSRTVGAMGNASVAFSHQEWRLDQPSPTVSATEEKGAGNRSTRRARGEEVSSSAGVDRASDALLLATGRRRLEPYECAILQDFPTDYPFKGKRGSVYAQVGNACPPRLVEAVVREVLKVDRRL